MDKTAEQLGLAAELMYRSNHYRQFPVACLGAWIKPAIELRQMYFLFDHEGQPLSYWTWAFLAPDVEDRWKYDARVRLHESEWNEGDHLWIMDLVCQRGYLRSVIAYMQRYMFAHHNKAFSLRRKRDGTTRKISVWHRNPRFDKKYFDSSLLKLMPPESFAASKSDYLESERPGNVS